MPRFDGHYLLVRHTTLGFEDMPADDAALVCNQCEIDFVEFYQNRRGSAKGEHSTGNRGLRDTYCCLATFGCQYNRGDNSSSEIPWLPIAPCLAMVSIYSAVFRVRPIRIVCPF